MANVNKEELVVKLFEINAVKFGDFTTKSGIKTPVYFDLRVIVSYPDVMDMITTLLGEIIKNDADYDHLCGVPYTALPIATLLSVKLNKPMLMRRKEAKAYGTKKMIEGHYKTGESCLIIEDVVTSGSSVLETINDLRKEGLNANKAIIILDREQGGLQNLRNNNVEMKSLFTMTQLMEILVKQKKISLDMSEKVKSYLLETKIPTQVNSIDRTKMKFEKRANVATNSISKRLFTVMVEKKTNLCISVDLTSSVKILELIKRVGPHVCMVKTHVDIIEDFNDNFVRQLKELSEKLNFLILEDRKFADIGNTVSLQLSKGMFKISEWADCVTVHSLPGVGVLKAISSAENGKKTGVFLLAEMSSEGNLITPEYKDKTAKMATEYPELMTGFVCQNKEVFDNPGLVQLTPGVQLDTSGDNLGQVYNTPEKIMLDNGADIAVVGRGIVAAADPLAQALIYKEKLWNSYEARVSQS